MARRGALLARRPSPAFVAQPHPLGTPGLSPGGSWQGQEDQGGMVICLAATTQGSSGHSRRLSVVGREPGPGWGSGLGPASSKGAWQPGWLCPLQGHPWVAPEVIYSQSTQTGPFKISVSPPSKQIPDESLHAICPTSSPDTRPSHPDNRGCMPAPSSSPSGPFSASIRSHLLKLKMPSGSSLLNSLPSLSLHALGPVLLTPCQLLLPP